MMFLKPLRVTDEDYLDHVRSLDCVSCNHSLVTQSDPHHLTTRGAGGSDYTAVPMCRLHHDEIHRGGLNKFEMLHGLDMYQALARCLASYLTQITGGGSGC
jgi:hypothetical protein